jgi:hypothetical protein
MSKSEQASIDNGEGISVFKFLRPSDSNQEGNCKYYYADKGCMFWNSLIEGMPNRHDFERTYNSAKMFAICVCVPADEYTEDTMQSVKIFWYDSHTEKEF